MQKITLFTQSILDLLLDNQLSHYYNAAASQYNQSYNLYSSPYYRFPYLPATNASAIYGLFSFCPIK